MLTGTKKRLILFLAVGIFSVFMAICITVQEASALPSVVRDYDLHCTTYYTLRSNLNSFDLTFRNCGERMENVDGVAPSAQLMGLSTSLILDTPFARLTNRSGMEVSGNHTDTELSAIRLIETDSGMQEDAIQNNNDNNQNISIFAECLFRNNSDSITDARYRRGQDEPENGDSSTSDAVLANDTVSYLGLTRLTGAAYGRADFEPVETGTNKNLFFSGEQNINNPFNAPAQSDYSSLNNQTNTIHNLNKLAQLAQFMHIKRIPGWMQNISLSRTHQKFALKVTMYSTPVGQSKR